MSSVLKAISETTLNVYSNNERVECVVINKSCECNEGAVITIINYNFITIDFSAASLDVGC